MGSECHSPLSPHSFPTHSSFFLPSLSPLTLTPHSLPITSYSTNSLSPLSLSLSLILTFSPYSVLFTPNKLPSLGPLSPQSLTTHSSPLSPESFFALSPLTILTQSTLIHHKLPSLSLRTPLPLHIHSPLTLFFLTAHSLPFLPIHSPLSPLSPSQSTLTPYCTLTPFHHKLPSLSHSTLTPSSLSLPTHSPQTLPTLTPLTPYSLSPLSHHSLSIFTHYQLPTCSSLTPLCLPTNCTLTPLSLPLTSHSTQSFSI